MEDYTPLPDVYGAIRQHIPGQDREFYLRSARELVEKLWVRGFVCLYYDDLAKSTESHRHVTELTPQEVRAEFAKESNWFPETQPVPCLCSVAIGATEEGEQAMYDWPRLS